MKKAYLMLFTLAAILLSACGGTSAKTETKPEETKTDKVAIAYVTSWTSIMPKTDYITHINYAFGHVNETFNGVKVDNGDRLHQIVALREAKPSLKILLSIGGWESGRFSEMAATKENRDAFAKDCQRVVKEYKLDGIDVDWEYPTSSEAGISSAPEDRTNFTLLMADIRQAIGKDKLLTIASASTPKYINFEEATQYLDYVNIMAYDMGRAPYHHASLHRSAFVAKEASSVEEAVIAHNKAGVPMEKLVMGVPFYGKGSLESKLPTNYADIIKLDDNYIAKWDEVGQAPYIVDKKGTYICGYDTPESIALKAKFVLDNNMLGMMYWEYSGDDAEGSLQKAVYGNLNK